jgi:hypothetical protein
MFKGVIPSAPPIAIPGVPIDTQAQQIPPVSGLMSKESVLPVAFVIHPIPIVDATEIDHEKAAGKLLQIAKTIVLWRKNWYNHYVYGSMVRRFFNSNSNRHTVHHYHHHGEKRTEDKRTEEQKEADRKKKVKQQGIVILCCAILFGITNAIYAVNAKLNEDKCTERLNNVQTLLTEARNHTVDTLNLNTTIQFFKQPLKSSETKKHVYTVLGFASAATAVLAGLTVATGSVALLYTSGIALAAIGLSNIAFSLYGIFKDKTPNQRWDTSEQAIIETLNQVRQLDSRKNRECDRIERSLEEGWMSSMARHMFV